VHILHPIHQHRQMTINEFIAKYNSDKFDSYIKDNATIDYWHDLIKTYKLERLKFVFPDAMQLTLNPLLQEGNDIFFGVAFDRFCERQIKILEIKQQHKPQEPDSGITEEINYANDNIENVRNQIKESYPKDLILFLTENPLADEAFYLKRELKGYKKALKTLNKDTAFNNFSEVNEDTPRFRNFFFRITESCNFFKLRLKELQQPENGIMAANEYVLFIVNSYFDAQESLGNEPDLINLVKDLFQQTVLRFGKKQETENFMTTYEFNSRIYFALNAMMQCGYNDDWETSNSTKFMRIETIVKDIKRPISRIEFKNIGDWIEELISINPPEQTNTNNTDEVKKSHPKHNPNDWNTDCFEFFKYLFDEYYNDKKRTNTKLICIWFYLSEYNPEKYILKITKDNYKIFIKKNFGITITNTDKPQNYDSKVLSTLHEHRKNFEDSLK
jgi:hypothetical protein